MEHVVVVFIFLMTIKRKDHKTLLFEKFLTAGHGYICDGDTLRIRKKSSRKWCIQYCKQALKNGLGRPLGSNDELS